MLGQPPFSHVTEKALIELYHHISAENNKNDRQKQYEHILSKKLDLESQRPKKLHEELGIELAICILRKVIRTNAQDVNQFMWLVANLALLILTEHSLIYKSVHHIIDSALDVDKLDYVPRDLRMSGVDASLPEFERILGSFHLVLDNNKFKFLPSIRVLKSIEEFFRQRDHLYKFVICHHRVAKTDGLLREIVLELAREHFGKDEPEETPDPYLLPKDISGLWKIIDLPQAEMARLPSPAGDDYFAWLESQYLQWDDSWLLSVLRNYYFGIKGKNGGRNGIDNETLMLKVTELLSNRKYYQSLYKRFDTFLEVDERFRKEMEQSGQVHDIDRTRLQATAKRVIETFLDHIDPDGADIARHDLREYGILVKGTGALLSIICADFDIGELRGIVSEAINGINNEFQLDSFFEIKTKSLEPGVKKSFKLLGEDSIVDIGEVSGIATDLLRSRYLFPPFFVYVYREKELTNQELREIRASLGIHMWGAIHDWLKSQGG